MDVQGLQIELALKRVVSSVKGASRGQQEPWMEGSIEGEFCFGECGKQVAQTSASDDRVFWESVKDSRDVNEVKAYLEQFPRGIFAGIARARVAALDNSAPQVAMAKPAQTTAPVSESVVTGAGLRLVVSVGVFADADKARDVRLKLEKAGLKTYLQVAESEEGKRTRVRVGPFSSRAEADKAASKIKTLDLPATILSL
jgi:cell division protein FtsN